MTNEQIATEVMGWEVEGPDDDRGFTWYSDDGGKLWSTVNNLPDFLNDHNAAMMVVEKMREDGELYMDTENNIWNVTYMRDSNTSVYIEQFDTQHKSLCHAICTAALAAKGG